MLGFGKKPQMKSKDIAKERLLKVILVSDQLNNNADEILEMIRNEIFLVLRKYIDVENISDLELSICKPSETGGEVPRIVADIPVPIPGASRRRSK